MILREHKKHVQWSERGVKSVNGSKDEKRTLVVEGMDLNCSCGRGYVAITAIVGNCGKM